MTIKSNAKCYVLHNIYAIIIIIIITIVNNFIIFWKKKKQFLVRYVAPTD